ncbi:YopX family protein [Jeotgalibaca porci]|uniref:YopX family protein n=1 Tax=Jeotgalibaca porci TaxID=1868793 RepID=UPI0035A19895
MREIKFRVWCKQYEEFIQFNKMGFLEDGSLWYVQGVDENEEEINPPYFENQNDWELMQYTDLKDTNGVEIYDGDVIRFILGDYNIREYVEEVVYSDGAFWCGNWLLFDAKMNDDDLEVLGNIYENPELLEREAE